MVVRYGVEGKDHLGQHGSSPSVLAFHKVVHLLQLLLLSGALFPSQQI